MPEPTKKIGLALSGGGYRATAFHLGTMKKLDELGILQHVDVISTISGGSITGACYCSHQGDFASFYDGLYNGLRTKNVTRNVLLSFTFLGFVLFSALFLGPAIYFLGWSSRPWLFVVFFALYIFVLLKVQFQVFPVSKRIEKLYDKFFYHKKKLGDLNDKPTLVIGATNLQTARPFSFSKYWMQDSTYQFMDEPVKFKSADFPLARAVMASSCVPFAFTPVSIHKDFFQDPAMADKFHPVLVDGGVYDNQGIHKVMQAGQYECGFVITSDAGCGSSGEMKFKNTFALLMETVNVFMSRIKKSQMVRNVYDNAATAKKQVAYYSLGWNVENCIGGFVKNLEKKQITETVINAHQLKPEWIADPESYTDAITDHLKTNVGYNAIEKPTKEEKEIARGVSTNLKSLSRRKIDCLIKQAQALTEIQVKLYCPSLINQKQP